MSQLPTIERVWDSPEIVRIDVPLPRNPLKNLNCYVLRQGEETLVIDTGFRFPECEEAFAGGLRALDVSPERCTLFLTHLHTDHTGLALFAQEMGMQIRMGSVDYDRMQASIEGGSWRFTQAMFRENGFPEDVMALQARMNPARSSLPPRMFSARRMENGDRFTVGGLTFECVLTPGHTPGHMCLYLPQEKLLFSGDHILYDITPNISVWTGVADSLGNYLRSLDAVERLEVVRAFPAHRRQGEFYPRIRELKEHHRVRLEEAHRLLRERDGQTAYAVAQRMTWSMRGLPWAQFPPGQKWFATGEAISHLEHLCVLGRAEKTYADGMRLYTAR